MTKIEWTHRQGTTGITWNPITGCTKISEGCKHCYAEKMSKRLAGRFGYPADDPFAVTPHFDKFDAPLKWRKPRTVFVCSMGDLFHEDVGFNVHQIVWDVMEQTPQHTYLILTKRADNMLDTVELLQVSHGILPNVWLGVTAENQKRANERIPLLLQTPAAVRFVSIEPLLDPVDIEGALGFSFLDPTYGYHYEVPAVNWIIVGGETGPGARPMHPDWARGVRDQCTVAGVRFFFKQMSRKAPIPDDLMIREWPQSCGGE
jgi:protein gp37